MFSLNVSNSKVLCKKHIFKILINSQESTCWSYFFNAVALKKDSSTGVFPRILWNVLNSLKRNFCRTSEKSCFWIFSEQIFCWHLQMSPDSLLTFDSLTCRKANKLIAVRSFYFFFHFTFLLLQCKGFWGNFKDRYSWKRLS